MVLVCTNRVCAVVFSALFVLRNVLIVLMMMSFVCTSGL